MNLSIYKELDSDTLSLKVLCLYAYSLNECTPKTIEKFAKKECVSKSDLYRKIIGLQNRGWLFRIGFDWASRETVWMIMPELCIPLYVYMLSYHKEWLQGFSLLYSGQKKTIYICK